jgi:hypothetical protein
MLRRAYQANPYEFVLTILVVFAAVMAAFTGYSSGLAGEEETDLRGAGLNALTLSNTNALQANQIILRDERILDNADFAEIIGEPNFALSLRNKTRIVQLGFLDPWGEPAPPFSTRSEAVTAYIEAMYAPQRANQTASEQAFAKADIVGVEEVNYLLVTILFALGAVLASQGMAADSQRVRRLFMYIVLGFLVFPVGLTIFTVFG